MKIHFAFLIFTLLWIAPRLLLGQSTNQIAIGQIETIQSKILKEKRKIWVHVPQSYRNGTYAKQRYPVVYLLDGEGHFSSVVGMIEQLSTVNGNTVCPEMIVVGIPNTDRMRDLTPTPGGNLVPSPADSIQFKTTGGGEKFTAFIERELIPHIDSIYPTQPYRVFIGHSLGGLMVINTLVHHPSLFNAYVAIDPSMWWSNQKLLNESKYAFATQKYTGKSLFVGIANTMDSGMDTLAVLTDTAANNNHIRSILSLNRLLKANGQNELRYQGKYYPDEDHSSLPLITEYDALHFIFNSYRIKLTSKDFEDNTTELASRLTTHFAAVSDQMSYAVRPPEALVNELGYYSLSEQKFIKAESLFKLNVANYPTSFNVYDSYGDYLVARKDTANAVAQFRKALSLKDNATTRKKLTALQAKAPPKPSSASKPSK